MKQFITILILIFSIGKLYSQNKPIKDDVAYQTSFLFDLPLSKVDAIIEFTSKTLDSKGYTFEPEIATLDDLGIEHQRNQEYFNGLKIEFGTLITHSKGGQTFFINAEIYNAGSLDLTPKLSKLEVFTILLHSKNGALFMWDNPEQAALMNYVKPEGELVILPNVKTGEVNLAYKYDVYTTKPLARDYIYLDANTGKLLLTNAIIKHANDVVVPNSNYATSKSLSAVVAGSAATRYSGTQVIETTRNLLSNSYVLQDFTRGSGIFTYNSQRSPSYNTIDFKDVDNNWIEYNNLFKDNAALDAHWGAEKTYDFWKTNFNRNSYDNLGTAIKSFVHYREDAAISLVNAFWNSSVMSYGDGNSSVSPLTSVDVCGHEIGHAVCSATAALVYANQSGALNEGFSDIWGACTEHFARTGALSGTPDANVWLIADQLGASPFRSMNNPLLKGDPDTYLGTNWLSTADEGSCVPIKANDYCGVHSNSGVLNHWFYILTAGKTGTNNAPTPDVYNVTGIGMVKSAQIAYLLERDYLTPNATFLDARIASIQVASAIYCTNSIEVNAVKNAWFAVNVGESADTYAVDVAIKNITQVLNVSCGATFSTTVKIENSGTNAINQATINYAIDGGTPVTQTWNGNLNTCQTFDYQLTFPALARGTHSVAITVSTLNDGNSSNNSRTLTILSNNTGTTGQINTFENITDNLISYEDKGTNILWQRGTAAGTVLTNLVAENSKVYGTILNGLYPNATKSYLVSQCYNLAAVTDPILKFDMAFDLELDYDLVYVQYSINAGVTWSVLGTSADINWYNSNKMPNDADCQNCVGAQWTGEGILSNSRGGLNANKRDYSYNLSSFGLGGINPQANIIFRFVFQSDAAAQGDGVIIDNFVVTTSQLLSNQSRFSDDFSVIPNPSNGSILVRAQISTDLNVQLFDCRGRRIFNTFYKNNNSSFNQQIDFGTIEKGIYLLTIISDGKQITKKLIIN